MTRSKHLSRAICMALAFCFMFSAVLCLSPAKAYASTDPNVQLLYAQRDEPGEAAYGGYLGYVDVKNLAYQKNVTVHYTTDGKSWQDVSAQYLKNDPEDPQYDVWEFSIFAPSSPATFAIKYEVNGKTYWDNNNGNNYTLSPTVPIVLEKCVLKTAQLREGTPTEIFLKNLGYEKTVLVKYTTDNWATSKSASASYEKSLPGNVEQWKIPSDLPHGSNVKYFVSYTVDGITYIDNNFGNNYTHY
ncbi:hypothetical protein [Caproicibacter sp.]|uniref:hypothetical protein n=1 Tax=Caproicibacter sp. TaxID=2814884 RepID=UPI00398A303B